MQRLGLLAAAMLAALFTAAPPAAAAETVPGEILVRFKSNAGASDRAEARRAARVAVKRSLRIQHAQLVRTEAGQSVEKALAALERQGSVIRATPNWIARASATSPNDTHYGAGALWGLHNFGQAVDTILGLNDADIDAPEAWDIEKDATDVVVAVADTGVRYDHPDLAGNIDPRGRDFIDDDTDATDLAEHGTHVAGTIAAEGNNGIGVTGVAWDAKILPVRVLDEDGAGSGDAILDGLDYAGDMGARVVNASLGGPGDATTGQFYADVMNAHPDTLYVVAAGNEANHNDGSDPNNPRYPCNTPVANLVCVAATDHKDQLAGFSNFGTTSVDLGAPGVKTYSTYPEVAQTGFADDFEGTLGAWTMSGGWDTFVFTADPKPWPDAFLREAPAGGYGFSNDADLSITSPVYDLTGRKGCVLGYDLFHEYDFQKDGLLVQVSVNGGTFQTRDQYTGTNDSVEELFTNLNADGQSSVRFRFYTLVDNTLGDPPGDRTTWFGSLIDNVRVTCQATPDVTSYGYMSGTSMASPHVAGVAALLFGERPDADASQVRSWLLSSGDPIAALTGKTVTGRRLNAHSALQAATGAVAGPEVVTDAAADVTESGATLRGRIDPNGVATTYKFVYGTSSGALTQQVPAAPVSVGSGTSLVQVSQPLSGLTTGTTYHYRLVAIQGGTETVGQMQSFTPAAAPVPAKPSFELRPATGVGDTVATVGGLVDPGGSPASILLEFGRTSGSYTSSTNELVVDDISEVSVELTGLTPGTKYFYRLRGSNANGEAVSPELSFTTTGAISPVGGFPLPTTGGSGPAANPPVSSSPPPAPRVSVTCKLNKRTRKPVCKAGATAAVKVSVLIMRGSKVFSRGKAASLTVGKRLRMKTPRRMKKGRYTLRITASHNGAIVTTLKKTIRL